MLCYKCSTKTHMRLAEFCSHQNCVLTAEHKIRYNLNVSANGYMQLQHSRPIEVPCNLASMWDSTWTRCHTVFQVAITANIFFSCHQQFQQFREENHPANIALHFPVTLLWLRLVNRNIIGPRSYKQKFAFNLFSSRFNLVQKPPSLICSCQSCSVLHILEEKTISIINKVTSTEHFLVLLHPPFPLTMEKKCMLILVYICKNYQM